jgi:3-mercaptopyruvate sulfurtransferase SseA
MVPEAHIAQKYMFSKPMLKQNMIFYCRSGKRSATAAELASSLDYSNIRNYKGSWLEWSEKEKNKEED